MSKLLAFVLVLTLSPGYQLWVTLAGLLPALLVLSQEIAEWLRTQREPVPIRVRSIASMHEARLREKERRFRR